MSITVIAVTSLILNLLFAFNAVAVQPPKCSDFPVGCTCTTQNTSVTDGIKGEVTYGIFVVTVICDGIGLTEVPDFTNHTRVENINLPRNKITKVRRRDFAMLSYLNYLDLSDNLIDEIETDSFSSTRLQRLLLEHNNLTSLPPRFFVDPEEGLTLLDLSYNKFTEVPSNFLYNTPDILTLYLSHNPIGGILPTYAFARNNSFSTMEDLFLINCSIFDIQYNAFFGLHDLQTLSLDHNNLRNLRQDMLVELPSSMQLLSATYNKIESIDQDTFEKMGRLSDLYLDHNEITTIQARTFKDFQFMKILSLQENQISRIAKKAFAKSSIEYLNVRMFNNKKGGRELLKRN